MFETGPSGGFESAVVDPYAKRDGLYFRLKTKALSNQLAISVGSSCSNSAYSIPSLAKQLITNFDLEVSIEEPDPFFDRWNDVVIEAEKKITRPKLIKFVHDIVSSAKPQPIHRKLAEIPISNYIDTTFDRSLHMALLEVGRKPIVHDWGTSQAMGIWKQTKPEEPTIFYMLPPTDNEDSGWGIFEPTSKSQGRNIIQIENVRDMLLDKDLVLLDYPAQEAESVLHLYHLHLTTEKMVNYTSSPMDSLYWARRGVYLNPVEPEAFLDKLLPYRALRSRDDDRWEYSGMDGFISGRTILSAMRKKPYDCFISYFSGDKDFVRRLSHDLGLRDVEIWLDDGEIKIGDSISGKIEEGLARSYTFIIVLSPEALIRPWVKQELRAAYALKMAGEFKILPVLHKECEIPLLLADYRFADFRDEKRYFEQLGLLENGIKSAVRKAQHKR